MLLWPVVSGEHFHPGSRAEQHLSNVGYTFLPGHMQVSVVMCRCCRIPCLWLVLFLCTCLHIMWFYGMSCRRSVSLKVYAVETKSLRSQVCNLYFLCLKPENKQTEILNNENKCFAKTWKIIIHLMYLIIKIMQFIKQIVLNSEKLK